MSPKPTSALRHAWYRWKSLKLPWRKRFLAGLDLEGNTFWEFRDTFSSHKHRMRRIVQYRQATHLSDVRISPKWLSWLRHTRSDPPSLVEQSQDLVRQKQLKALAAQADARWAAKGSFLDRPRGETTRSPSVLAVEHPHSSHTESPKNLDDRASLEPSGGPPAATATGKYISQSTEPREPVPVSFDTFTQEDGQKTASKATANPWKPARGAPGEEWQPKSWPGTVSTPR